MDEEIRNAAVNGEFNPECKRWVKWNDTYHLALCFERNDRLYQTGKKIPSARYRSGTLYVNVSHWEEVQEYAKAFGFQFSSKGTRRNRKIQKRNGKSKEGYSCYSCTGRCGQPKRNIEFLSDSIGGSGR